MTVKIYLEHRGPVNEAPPAEEMSAEQKERRELIIKSLKEYFGIDIKICLYCRYLDFGDVARGCGVEERPEKKAGNVTSRVRIFKQTELTDSCRRWEPREKRVS